MIGIIDYGSGNLRSVQNALNRIGAENAISSDPVYLSACDKFILPGVGAFGDCMNMLKAKKLDQMIIDQVQAGKPLLGICLGMQMLYESSEENGLNQGFGFLKGKIRRLQGDDIRIPEIGWNLLEKQNDPGIFSQLSVRPFVYYVHSYYATQTAEAEVYGYSMHGTNKVPGFVGRNNVLGCQFHPEKSGKDGSLILQFFAKGGNL